MKKIMIAMVCGGIAMLSSAMEPASAPVEEYNTTVRVLALSRYFKDEDFGLEDVYCMRDDNNNPGQLVFPGGRLNNPHERAVDAACRKFKEQVVGLRVAPESLKLIALLTRFFAQDKTEYCQYYYVDQNECEGEWNGENHDIEPQCLDTLLSDKMIFSRLSEKPHLRMSQATEKIVRHLKAGCKKSEQLTLLDPRQLSKPKANQDPMNVMTLELFARDIPE